MRAAAVSAVPVAVETVSTVPVLTVSPAAASAAETACTVPRSAGTDTLPKPSSAALRKPSGVSAPRSAAIISLATTSEPKGATPGNPPPIPALITQP
ncbi:hypothetical protein D3C78_949570 [compost metagenome]